jgi:hypothetical protein
VGYVYFLPEYSPVVVLGSVENNSGDEWILPVLKKQPGPEFKVL